jgi:hypothetical protein
MGQARGRNRRSTAVMIMVAALVAAIASIGSAGAVAPAPQRTAIASPAKAGPSLTILTRGQRTVMKRRTARVGVRVTRSGSYRLALTLRRLSGGPSVSAGRKTLRLRRGKRRVLSVRLTPAARRLLGCSKLRLTATLRAKAGGKPRHRTAVLLPDPARCAAAKKPGIGSGGSPQGGGTGAAGTASPTGGSAAAPGGATPQSAAAQDVVVENPAACDPIDPAVCLQPWPNNYFVRRDAATPTKLRLNLKLEAMPRSGDGNAGKPIQPDDYNASDGFSPGQMITTRVPGLDTPEAFRATGAVPVDDPQRSLDANAPVLVINATTGKRQLVWSEIDSNPADPANRNLIIRPAINFDEGQRYIVALRRLKDGAGKALEPRAEFKALRDRLDSSNAAVNGRRADMEEIFARLAGAEIPVARDDLYLAWDFTVASAKSTTGRMLSIRDRAFAALGDTNLADLQVQGKAPTFRLNTNFDDNTPEPTQPDTPPRPISSPVSLPTFSSLDGVRDFKRCSAGADPNKCERDEDDNIARTIRGMFTIPCYLNTAGCATGGQFSFVGAPDEYTPTQIPNNTYEQPFQCNIPRKAVSGSTVVPARPSLYGHGLFGGLGEVNQGQLKDMSNEHNFMFCATDWDGMATKDVPNTGTVLADLSRFPSLIDHVEQGFLNFLYLGRLMIHPGGFNKDPAFKGAIDTQRLYYDGNSQGGIYGGTLAAIGVDHTRATLGVPGMNYSTLLRRSTDFSTYAQVLYKTYPNELQRPLILSLLNVLWDRGDPDGYAHHMTDDPLPNTPPHEVLLHSGFGDHQVSDVTAEVEARTIGALGHRPVLEMGRPGFSNRPYPALPDLSRFSELPSLGEGNYSVKGASGLVFWDVGPPRGDLGTLPPDARNRPPSGPQDPHEFPRKTPAARQQKSDFLRPNDVSAINDVCHGPCFTIGYSGGAPQP